MSESEEAKVDAKDDEGDVGNSVNNTTPNCTLSENAPEAAKRSKCISDSSAALIAESMNLLGMKSSTTATLRPPSSSSLYRSRSPSPVDGSSTCLAASSPAIARRTPQFKRVDFDDRLEEMCEDRRAPWKTWQESVKDSYHKAKRTVERNKDETDFLESTLGRVRRTRGSSPFHHLDGDTGFIPSVRSSSSLAMPSLSDRTRLATSASMNHVFASGSGPYAAPAVSSSQGIESRYEGIARDVEARLLKNLPLPTHMKTITTKEFRNAPNASAGSATEKDDYDFSAYCPKPYYSRPNRDDPDYFDYDLQHSVDLFKRPEGKYTPRGPQEWETKLLGEATAKGSAPVSGYMFTKGDSDWRSNGSSYLSAALRTPKFWEQRFENLGKQVRDSNPVSLDSINRRIRQIEDDRRNRQVMNRFSEYRDPDFEDYVDPRADDDY